MDIGGHNIMFRSERHRKLILCSGSPRQMKNICFTVAMLIQVLFWTYVLFTPNTKASNKIPTYQDRTIKENIDLQGLHESESSHYIKPLLVLNPSHDQSDQQITVKNKEDKIPKVRKHARVVDKPHGRYLDDVLKFVKQTDAPTETDFNRYFNPLLHHTILPRDTSVVWNSSFLKNPTSICSRHSDLDLLLIVHTAPYNFRRRNMIRQHVYSITPYTVQLAFMIGTVAGEKYDGSKEVEINSEFEKHEDLVRMDFQEDFRNLSLKAIMWLKWTNEHCKNAQMILKIDDDVVIDIRKILPLSRGVFSKYKRAIFCHLNKIGSQPIPRIGRTKVDPREFMRMSFYPYNYCSGFIVFLTPDLISSFVKTAKTIPFYNVDDVFMFGMVPKYTGLVTYHNIGYNVSIWNAKVLKCSLAKGILCPYFGTMGEEEDTRQNVWNAMKDNHKHDFHFPQTHIL